MLSFLSFHLSSILRLFHFDKGEQPSKLMLMLEIFSRWNKRICNVMKVNHWKCIKSISEAEMLYFKRSEVQS